jgi:hypothetical protein
MQTQQRSIQINSSRIQKNTFRNDLELLNTLFMSYKEQFLIKRSEKTLAQLQRQVSPQERTATAVWHGNELLGLYSSK